MLEESLKLNLISKDVYRHKLEALCESNVINLDDENSKDFKASNMLAARIAEPEIWKRTLKRVKPFDYARTKAEIAILESKFKDRTLNEWKFFERIEELKSKEATMENGKVRFSTVDEHFSSISPKHYA